MKTQRLLGDRYRLTKMIGRGGMSTVYSAVDVVSRRDVAVKVFRAPADRGDGARFASEAALLASLSHPGLVHVLDLAVSEGQSYMVMQLVRGRSLRELIARGGLGWHEVARIAQALATTLGYVHSRRIVHRDVKPANVLVTEDGGCFLTDFGVARAIGSARLTASGSCVGTAAYLAPEQVAGADVGPPADVYALGLVLLECFTGVLEYPGTEIESAVARLHRAPRVPEWLPTRWRSVISRMTRRNPARRPTALECARMLEAVLATGADEVVTVPSPRAAALSTAVHAI